MSDDPKKANGGPTKPKAEKPAHPTESSGYPVAVLLRAEGAYRDGLRVTTDPSRPSDPKGREPIRVDAGRFAAWAKAGAFERLESPEKPTSAQPGVTFTDEQKGLLRAMRGTLPSVPLHPPTDPPLVPMDETPPEEPEKPAEEEV